MMYMADDGECCWIVWAGTLDGALRAAARDAALFVSESGLELDETMFLNLRVQREGEEARMRLALDPPEPPCDTSDGHTWRLVSIAGHGGGTITTDRCSCGAERRIDTWAQDSDGTQGLRSVRYSA